MDTFNEIVIYLFHPTPGRAFGYYYFITALILLLTGLGIFLRIYIKKNREDKTFKKLFRKYPMKLWTLALVLALYLLVRYYYVPFFSMRVLFYTVLGITLYLFYQIINTYLKTYPAEKKRRDERTVQNRYKIKKKKRKKKR